MIIWKRLLGRGCSHRFSWPRIDADGRHYQICLLCGTAYEYDWTMMRQTGRLLVTEAAHGLRMISNPPHPSQTMP
jgi:hypothetical protein